MTALFLEQGTVSKTASAVVQPTLPAEKVRTEKKVIVPCKLTDTRADILTYLIEWRFGTTNQLWRELQMRKSKLKAHTTRDLEKLRAAGLVYLINKSGHLILSPRSPQV